jgi:hypothetical protein
MANDEIDKMEVHPLVKALESKGEVAVEFRGFVGAGDEKTLRLYADLGMSAYVDIPRDAIIHAEPDSTERGKARAFVRADQKVVEVHRYPVTAQHSAFSTGGFPTTGDDDFREPERGGLIGCYGRCESAFAIQAGIITQLRNIAFTQCAQYGLDSERCQQATNAATQAEQRAVGILEDCIKQCRIAYPITLFPPRPVAEIVAAIVKKYGFTYAG